MLSIGDFSKISHVTTKTLRYYDEIDLLKPKYINPENGYRYYDLLQLETILFIKRLKDYSFSLDEIKRLSENNQDKTLLQTKINQKKREIEKKLQDYSILLERLENDVATLERGMNIMSYLNQIEVKLTETPEMNILSIRKQMNVNDYGKYLAQLFRKISTEKLTPVGPPMTIYHSQEYDPENYDMEIAVPIVEKIEGTRKLSAYLSAKSSFTGYYSELPAVYVKISEWIEKQGYQISGSPYDIYITDPTTTDPKMNVTEVYFPVEV